MGTIKKGNINGKLVDIVGKEEYINNRVSYEPSMTAIEYDDIAYPVYETEKVNYNKPGIYIGSVISQFVKPSEENINNFSISNNDTIIDFSNIESGADMLAKTKLLKNVEKDILTNPDNLTVFPIDNEDSPEMKAVKECINSKKINLDNYSGRFVNYNNEKRIIKNKHDITLSKILNFANALDLKCTLTIEDKDANVPNPMNNKVTVILNAGGNINE